MSKLLSLTARRASLASRASVAPVSSPFGSDTRISNIRMIGEGGVNAELSPAFASLGYKPDPYTAFMEFEVCNCLPSWLGPVGLGSYIGFYPAALAISHESMIWKQVNIRHLLKVYSVKDDQGYDSIANDRIIGCVIATSFPRPPMGGWDKWTIPANADDVPRISALACIFKNASGVPALLGGHITDRTPQSVSMECITPLPNTGILIPSTNELMPFLNPTDEILSVMENMDAPLPTLARLPSGEQPLTIYGMGKPIQFRGAGITPEPAEKNARIVGVNAESSAALMHAEFGNGALAGITAERVSSATLKGQVMKFGTGNYGQVESVVTTGTARLPGARWGINASLQDPALIFRVPGGRVIHPLSRVAAKLGNLGSKK